MEFICPICDENKKGRPIVVASLRFGEADDSYAVICEDCAKMISKGNVKLIESNEEPGTKVTRTEERFKE